jgi:molybdopterin molybdotransferase
VVSVITTGDEAVPPGTRLRRGQIYDSNSHMMAALLKRMGIENVSRRHVGDRVGLVSKAIRRCLAGCDVLVVVGGVSVGDRDCVRPALREVGVREVFWQVAQKPGKPLYFGVREGRLIFGFPGNPASAFTCFYEYMYPALRRMSGFRTVHLPARTVIPSRAVTPDKKVWRFLRARLERATVPTVTELRGQGSHMVASLAGTNGFIVVPPGVQARDDALETHELPHAEDP